MIRAYAFGFVLSLLLTLASFLLAPTLGAFALPVLVFAALLQLFVQVYFFLQVGRGKMAGSYTLLLTFAAVIIGILVGGSLWIMANLRHQHLMPTMQDLYEHGVVAPQNELR